MPNKFIEQLGAFNVIDTGETVTVTKNKFNKIVINIFATYTDKVVGKVYDLNDVDVVNNTNLADDLSVLLDDLRN